MLKEKTTTYFKENPNKRILFFFDPEEEYSEEVEELEKSGVEVVRAGSGYFKLKYRLENELKDKKIFLYFKKAEPSESERNEYALLDLLVANKVLRLDQTSEFIEEFNLNSNHIELVKKYIKMLKTKAIKKFISTILNYEDFTQNSLEPALISYILDLKKIENPEIILAGLMSKSLDKNKLLKLINKIIKLKLDKRILHWIEIFFGYSAKELSINVVKEIINRFKYNLITEKFEPKKGDSYSLLKINNISELEKMKKIFWEWEKSNHLSSSLYEVLEKGGAEIKEDIIYEIYGADVDYNLLTIRLKLIILDRIILQINDFPEETEKKLNKFLRGDMRDIKLNKTVVFLNIFTQFILHLNSIKTYRFNKPENYIKKYSDELYKIDMLFRRGMLFYDDVNSEISYNVVNIEEFVKNNFLKKYSDFLIKLNNEWLYCLRDNGYKFNAIDTGQQTKFFKKYIENERVKVAVIISDALRYESGVQLLQEIHKDSKNEAIIGTMMSSIPSDTDIGMTNLLPHKNIEYKKGKYFIDGIETISTNRSKILNNYNDKSASISYDALIEMSQSEARELLKKDLVYIYHDTIDSAGHGNGKVLKAVDIAVAELSVLIKKLHSSWHATKVIITADHGFLFLPEKISDSMKEDPPKIDYVKYSKRYLITDKKIDRINNHIFPLKNASGINTNFQVILPNGINRFKIQGSTSARYLHGGASLQEMIVPIIESRRKKEDISVKVSIKLVSSELKILSGILKFILIQETKVSMTHKPLTIKAGIYNRTEPVSNIISHTFESTSDQASIRTVQLSIPLNSDASSLSVLKLRIFDEDDKLNPLIEEQVINKTLIEKDDF